MNFQTIPTLYFLKFLQSLTKPLFPYNQYSTNQETPTYGYVNKGEKGVFQRRYFEHTILSEEELNRHIDYIHYNPVKHNLVKNVKDWKYSSFHKFVEQNLYDINWGQMKIFKRLQTWILNKSDLNLSFDSFVK